MIFAFEIPSFDEEEFTTLYVETKKEYTLEQFKEILRGSIKNIDLCKEYYPISYNNKFNIIRKGYPFITLKLEKEEK
jgi:hypothetical protein